MQYLERLDVAALLDQPARGLDLRVLGEMSTRGVDFSRRQVREREERDADGEQNEFFHGVRRVKSVLPDALPLFSPWYGGLARGFFPESGAGGV